MQTAPSPRAHLDLVVQEEAGIHGALSVHLAPAHVVLELQRDCSGGAAGSRQHLRAVRAVRALWWMVPS